MVAGYAIGGGHVLHVICDLIDRRRQRDLRPDRPQGRQLRRRLRRQLSWRASSATRRPARSGSSAASTTRPRGARRWASSTRSCRWSDLEDEGVAWADEILAEEPDSPSASSSPRSATDGLAGLQELAGDATILFYTTDEAHEGRTPSSRSARPSTASTRAAREPAAGVEVAARAPVGLAHLAACRPARDVARGAVGGRRRPRGGGRQRRATPHRHGDRVPAGRPAAPDRRQLRERPVGLPARGRHARPAGPAARRGRRPGHAAPAGGGDRDHDRACRDRRPRPGLHRRTRPDRARGARRRGGARLHRRAVAVRLPRARRGVRVRVLRARGGASGRRTCRPCGSSGCTSRPRSRSAR